MFVYEHLCQMTPIFMDLGEHADSLRLNNTDYNRTLWSRDSYGVPSGQTRTEIIQSILITVVTKEHMEFSCYPAPEWT